MNRIALTLLLALTLPLAARADDASHRAKAKELITLLHTPEGIQHNADNLKTQLSSIASSTIGLNPTPEKKAEAENFLTEAGKVIDAKLTWTALEPGITDIYVKNFTEEQINAIVAFYKTPAGAALLANIGTVNNQISSSIGDRLNNEVKPQVMQMITAFKEKEAGPPTLSTLPSATPAPPAAASPTPSAPAASSSPAAPTKPAAPATPKTPAPAK